MSPAAAPLRAPNKPSDSGRTRLLHSMIDSATHSMTTMALAADSPPMKATIANVSCPSRSGSDIT